MKIHSSHSKRELCEICEVFDLNIEDYKDMIKKDLAPSIIYKLTTIDDIKADNKFYYIENKKELLEYLTTPNQSKQLTIKEKDKIMIDSKKIIQYCNNGYWLVGSAFEDWDMLLETAKTVSKYCDIPTARRAITLFNTDPKVDESIEPIISPRVKKLIDRKINMKKALGPKYELRRGKFLISFT
tara:strand:- start:1421 stop:1972 length:552 start_codon:yes stop_codon:yes gene_type:complete